MSAPPSEPREPSEPRALDAVGVRAAMTTALLALPKVLDVDGPIRDFEFALTSALQSLYRAASVRVANPDALRESIDAAISFNAHANSLLAGFSTDDAGANEMRAALAPVAGALRTPSLVWSGFGDLPALPSSESANATSARPDDSDPAHARRPSGRYAPVGSGPPSEASAGPVLALTDVPALLTPARAPLHPVVALPEDLAAAPPRLPDGPGDPLVIRALAVRFPPQPRVLDAQAERAQLGVALPESAMLFQRARLCFEDLAGFGNMRRTGDDLAWFRPRTEERLLARVDGIVACGAWVIPQLLKMLEDRPVPDPQLVWASIFLCGSLDGVDAVDQVMRLVETLPLGEPAMRGFVVDALSLAPHPLIGARVRPWLKSTVPHRRAMATTILSRRDDLALEEAVAAAGESDVDLVRAGVAAIARSRMDLVPALWRLLLALRDEATLRMAIAAAILHRSEAGVRKAMDLVRAGKPAFADAALFVAAAADEKHGQEILIAPLLMSAAASSRRPSNEVPPPPLDPILIRALGNFGHIDAVPVLLAQLDAGDAVAPEAALALHRITGAGLTKDNPAPEVDPAFPPFIPTLGPARPPVPVVDLSCVRAHWTAWWTAHKAAARAGTRYRHGHAWSPEDCLWDMEEQTQLRPARVWAYWEWVARTGVNAAFDPEHFIARQQNQIAELRQARKAAGDRNASDGWATRYRR